jgi:hypothetical protein
MWVASYAQVCRVQHAVHLIFRVALSESWVYELVNCILLQEWACLYNPNLASSTQNCSLYRTEKLSATRVEFHEPYESLVITVTVKQNVLSSKPSKKRLD